LFWFNRGREAANTARSAASAEARPLLGDDAPPALMFLRALVPGWTLRTVGATAAGWAVLVAWVGLLLMALVNLGYQLSGLYFGLAFTLHYCSGLYATRLAGFDRVYTFRVGALLAVILVVFLYAPVALLQNQVFRPVPIIRSVGPFREGEVVLYTPLATSARPGQWLVFEIREGGIQQIRNAANQPANVNIQRGQYLAEVLAVPGDRVAWDGATLTVNGAAAPWQPAERRRPKKKEQHTVPPGLYFVTPWLPDEVPYNIPIQGPQAVAFAAGATSLIDPTYHVDADRVIGRVFFKLQPLSDARRVR
jgi:hypothetical protein